MKNENLNKTIIYFREQRLDQVRKKLLRKDSHRQKTRKSITRTLIGTMITAGAFLATAYHGQTLNDNYNPLGNSPSNATSKDHEYEERTLIKTPQEDYSPKTETTEENIKRNNPLLLKTMYEAQVIASLFNLFSIEKSLEEKAIESAIKVTEEKNQSEAIPYTTGVLMGYLAQRKTDILTSIVSKTTKTLIEACDQESKHKKILKEQDKQLTESTINHLFDTYIPQK